MTHADDPVEAPVDGRLIPAEDGPDRLNVDIGGGHAVMYCSMSPDKLSDNQDTAMVLQLGDDIAVLAVADGAGGIQGGRRASRLALTTLRESLLEPRDDDVQLRTAILNAMERANLAVIEATRGAATTLTVVVVEGREARVFHVGDSLALITGQRTAIRLHTVAHSPVGFAVAAGFLSEEEGMYHPERHIVSNFVGTHDMIIEVGSAVKLAKYDTVLLASDGLSDNLHVQEIIDMMRRGTIDDTLDNIVALAERRMERRLPTDPGKADDLALILFRKPD